MGILLLRAYVRRATIKGMKKMPPIPSFCKSFVELSCGWCFEVPENEECDRHQWAISNPGSMRKIIASVARCAWIDFGKPYIEGTHKKLVEANAELWRIWGNE